MMCLDNFITGSKDNVVYLLDHPRIELICDRMPDRPSQGVLSGTGQEHQPAAGEVYALELVDGEQENIT